MKYCIDFYGKQIDLLNKVDEINIDLSHIKNLIELKEFCELHKNQRINLCINDFEDAINNNYLTYTLNFQKENPTYNAVVRLPGYDNQWAEAIKKDYPDAKIYFKTYIIDWETLLFYLDYGVTDVFITEGMGFELDKIAEIVHSKEVNIRVYPNVAQSARKETKGMLKFWIRPEDIDFYDKYVDVCEFYYDNFEKQNIYYKIYAEDKKWMGDLSEIIIGLESGLDSTCIVPRFAHKRVRCNRDCLKGGKCKMCYRVIELSETLSKTPMRVTIDREKEDLNGERSNSESGNNKENIK